jgi:hypothetical protein
MKKVNSKGKLNLGKETISKLNHVELGMLIGGAITNACGETQQNTCKHIPTSPVICTK